MRAAGLRQYFLFGCFSDHYEMRRQVFQNGVDEARRRLGEQATVCFVGDTPVDVEAARQVGASIIAVGTGVYKSEDLLPYSPDVCVNSCAELLEAF